MEAYTGLPAGDLKMNHSASLAVAFGMLLASFSAQASEPVYLSVGQTKVLNVSRAIKSAQASDPALLFVKKKQGGTVLIEGKSLGTTPVVMRTRDGGTFEVVVRVIPPGASVYSLNRTEPAGQRTANVQNDAPEPVASVTP